MRQVSISKFVVAVERKEEQLVTTPGVRTPVSIRVKRLEDKVRSPIRTLRKVTKLKDKPGSKVQSTIKKFLISEVEKEEKSKEEEKNIEPSSNVKPLSRIGGGEGREI